MQDVFLRLSLWIADKRGCGWFGASLGTGINPPATGIGWLITGVSLAALLSTFLLAPAPGWAARAAIAAGYMIVNWWTVHA